MGGQSGQATVEWAGLMLCVALIFGALLAGGRGAAKGDGGRGLGEAVAGRITCAVRDACRAEAGARARGGEGAGRGGGGREVRGGGEGGARGGSGEGARGERTVGEDALRVVSKGRRFLKRTWFTCLAYRSWQNDRDHPRLLGEARPVKETVHMLNECVNPLSFLFGK